MKECIIYHNPRCSKSREALELLNHHQVNPTIVEYLKTPLNLEQLIQLRSHFALQDFVRTNEPIFKQLKLDLADESKVLAAMVNEPILMQRPIVIYNGKAVIARPAEKVLAVL